MSSVSQVTVATGNCPHQWVGVRLGEEFFSMQDEIIETAGCQLFTRVALSVLVTPYAAQSGQFHPDS